MKTIFLRVIIFMLLTTGLTTGVAAIEQHRQWEVISISFKSVRTYNNPYSDISSVAGKDLLKVTFNGISGEASGRSFTLTGFWNGGQEWRVNFAAPFTGKWNYVTSSFDRGLNNKKGSFEITPWSEENEKKIIQWLEEQA